MGLQFCSMKPGWKEQTQPGWLLHNFLYPLNPFISGLQLTIRHLLTRRSVALLVSFSFPCMTDFVVGCEPSSLPWFLLSVSLLSGVSRAVKYVNEFLATALCTQVMDVLSVQPCHLDKVLQCMVLQTNIAAGIPRWYYFMQLPLSWDSVCKCSDLAVSSGWIGVWIAWGGT